MKDTIEVPVELVKKLQEWGNRDEPDIDNILPWMREMQEVAEIISHLPTLELALEPCPACGGSAMYPGGTNGYWRCADVQCYAVGPVCDQAGSKWNAMARPARVLREIKEYVSSSHTEGGVYGNGLDAAKEEVLRILNGGDK